MTEARTPGLAGLPVLEILPDLLETLSGQVRAVLVAPPGAGKTTGVPLALLRQAWASRGKIVVLEPRRLAARAAAARMASLLGEAVGDTVGCRVRQESRVSERTRIEVVTEGVFTRMILDDPGLQGVAAVLFDEFHERSLDADLGLALARDSQAVLRGDLRLLVMSATLDGGKIAERLDGAKVIESRGRAHPIETRYLGRDLRSPIEGQMAMAIRRALGSVPGDILAFLPGQGEIRRTVDRLSDPRLDPDIDIFPLYAALDLASQDRAIAPALPGRRKVILATAIAETSLTVEGIRVVIDSGLARKAHWHGDLGLSRLRTQRVSRASADQRRGRAGRTAPGVCWRLWDEAETRALAPSDPPEILTADLSRLALDLAKWGAPHAEGLTFLDPPPTAAIGEARRLLRDLGALDEAGFITAHGEVLSHLPLPPRLAQMVILGARAGNANRAALLAAVISERGLGGRDVDISARVQALARPSEPQAKAALRLAEKWSAQAGPAAATCALSDGLLIASAFPERIAKARGERGQFQLASGRGAWLQPTEPLAAEPWLAVADLGGGTERDRILLAAPLDIELLRKRSPENFLSQDHLIEGPEGARRARRSIKLGALIVETHDLETLDPDLIAKALLSDVRREGLAVLPWDNETQALRARVNHLRARGGVWPDFSDEGLLSNLDQWLGPILSSLNSIKALKARDLERALRELLPNDAVARLNRDAPPVWTSPSGTQHPIDYAAQAGPQVNVRVQAVFGLTHHPRLPGGEPIILSLLSPAHRPVQVTRDLPGFWSGAWAEVRKDMRGRYPRHSWPEAPGQAEPTLRAKPRG